MAIAAKNSPWIAENLEGTSSCHRCHQTTTLKRCLGYWIYWIYCHGYLLYLVTVPQMMAQGHYSLVLLSYKNNHMFHNLKMWYCQYYCNKMHVIVGKVSN